MILLEKCPLCEDDLRLKEQENVKLQAKERYLQAARYIIVPHRFFKYLNDII